ncbi:DNA topoisomerase IV subunit A [Priestia filamentosa]|uniref:DNA topoisomerase IV subunit A n=1 Tax=Priestia filamentosa TaxID=1402861 RepID=UPI000A08DB26|nr:DNA topoisomerase IV subunit A [Priestia filamentosa]MDT3763619.1 DNA topoisomerase IV subunit A [Priestia filamentosa]OXS71887.1 DNA topoisomerase IV subunit A [Priestia filamentosa]WRU94051.1 DNA topoisomerase IV subunit A [Priestia filamentosa]SMF15479.1 topoisomerase-4 subunit A [Priestia filamentosa]
MEQTERYLDLPLEDVLGDRFGRYSKYIIQERALPDARDGLKPVQRRILYAMHVDGNTAEKGFRKSAKTVGNVIGNYHPHGDSSVYDAMVRMSQEWKVRNVLIEMHGNNGSIDGDPPAAMRYTEARLSSISQELLRDIDKNTVEFVPNFDDTSTEPTVLPAHFPNLLVNGSTGISAGYATDIPPHNLVEVIDAAIMRIDKKQATVEELMSVIKGPDFPTGGIIQGVAGIKKAYETGKGKIIVRGKASVESLKGGKEQIVITEIPYEVNKANLVKKMDELRLDRKVEGIAEVRDETDRTGLRIVIELKKDGNAQGILHYLYKNTDLQIPYNFNMVAIHKGRPKLMTLPTILDAYIDHQKEVVINRSKYEWEKAKEREHIVAGLIKALSILDEVIATIRASKDKRDAKNNLIKNYEFTEAQAEAIVSLQLYRLTNTDITALREESEELQQKIEELEQILNSEQKLLSLIKKELRQVKKTYKTDRFTAIEEEIEELKINLEVMVPSEDVMVTVTSDGYVKRTSLRSYNASNGQDFGMKETDHILGCFEVNTTETLLLFTNKGSYLYMPIHELPDIRWKDLGQHVSSLIPLDKEEHLIQALPIEDFKKEDYLLFATKNGMVKRTELKSFKAQRYSRPLMALNVKGDDEVVSVMRTSGNSRILLGTKAGYVLLYNEEEINVVGPRAAGVKGINLKDDDVVIGAETFITQHEDTQAIFVTQRGAVKKMNLKEVEQTSRAKRGTMILRTVKSNPHNLIGFTIVKENRAIRIESAKGMTEKVIPANIRVSELYSNGSFIMDEAEVGKIISMWIEKES